MSATLGWVLPGFHGLIARSRGASTDQVAGVVWMDCHARLCSHIHTVRALILD